MKLAPLHSTLVALIGVLFLGLQSAHSAIIIDYQDGTNSLTSVPGLELKLPSITDPGQASWQLNSFTWLSSSNAGATATGRLTLWVYDAALYDPSGKNPNNFSASDTGFVAQSQTYANGLYTFSIPLILGGSKTYYFLNAGVVSTAQGAPANYGANTTTAISDIQRWAASNGGSAWGESTGAPNFSLTLTPIPVPEPAIGLQILMGGLIMLLSRRGRRQTAKI